MCQRCEELEEEVAYLRSEMGLEIGAGQIATIRQAFNLSPACARLLLVLHRASGRVMSRLQMLDALPARYDGHEDRDERIVNVHVSRIRQAVGPGFIRNEWGKGYHLTAEGMNIIGTALGEVSPPVAGFELQDLNDRPSEELRGLAATIAGICAHRDGDGGAETAKTLRRIADRLTGQPRRAA
jgi:DNA-binding winged helix-turn-helix (wHTH) protein